MPMSCSLNTNNLCGDTISHPSPILGNHPGKSGGRYRVQVEKIQAMNFGFYGILLFAVVLEVVSDFYFKKWSVGHQTTALAIGLLNVIISSVIWAVSLEQSELSKATSIFTILNLVGVAVIGAVVFEESLSSINKIGLCLGVVSVVLVEI